MIAAAGPRGNVRDTSSFDTRSLFAARPYLRDDLAVVGKSTVTFRADCIRRRNLGEPLQHEPACPFAMRAGRARPEPAAHRWRKRRSRLEAVERRELAPVGIRPRSTELPRYEVKGKLPSGARSQRAAHDPLSGPGKVPQIAIRSTSNAFRHSSGVPGPSMSQWCGAAGPAWAAPTSAPPLPTPVPVFVTPAGVLARARPAASSHARCAASASLPSLDARCRAAVSESYAPPVAGRSADSRSTPKSTSTRFDGADVQLRDFDVGLTCRQELVRIVQVRRRAAPVRFGVALELGSPRLRYAVRDPIRRVHLALGALRLHIRRGQVGFGAIHFTLRLLETRTCTHEISFCLSRFPLVVGEEAVLAGAGAAAGVASVVGYSCLSCLDEAQAAIAINPARILQVSRHALSPAHPQVRPTISVPTPIVGMRTL